MNEILKCANLHKSYGKNEAVRNLDLKLEENTVYGLFGRNGAGKTTLLNMITGGIFPDHGDIKIGGRPLKPGESPGDTCYIREKNFYFGGAKVIEILELASSFHKNWDWTIAHELVNLFKLNPNNKMRQLSRGMESLVGNIVGLASRARFTIYDEPVIGLDVLMRDKFYKLLMEDYANNPRTILISTHLVDEISKVVGRIVIIEAGSILLHDDADNIRIHSHLVTGNTQAIEQFTSDKRVFYKESYGKGMFAAVYDKFSEADKALATKLGVEIDGLPLQKFFAYLIEGGEQVE